MNTHNFEVIKFIEDNRENVINDFMQEYTQGDEATVVFSEKHSWFYVFDDANSLTSVQPKQLCYRDGKIGYHYTYGKYSPISLLTTDEIIIQHATEMYNKLYTEKHVSIEVRRNSLASTLPAFRKIIRNGIGTLLSDCSLDYNDAKKLLSNPKTILTFKDE